MEYLLVTTLPNITFISNWILFFNMKLFLFINHIGIEGYGRGALAIEDLNVGDIALEIPVSIIISEECVYQSDMVYFDYFKNVYVTRTDNLPSLLQNSLSIMLIAVSNIGEDWWDFLWDNDVVMEHEGEAQH